MSSAGGALAELISIGSADKYLTQDPSITFWRLRYSRYSNFALESVTQYFQSHVQFGSDVQVTLNRLGDLVYFLYAVVELPGIQAIPSTTANAPQPYPSFSQCDPCGDGTASNPFGASEQPIDSGLAVDTNGQVYDKCTGMPAPWASWSNVIGHLLIKQAKLIIGGQVIDTLYSDYLFMWEELSGKPGKRLTEMIGKTYTRPNLIDKSAYTRKLYIPLPFWFTQTSGNALPLVSLQFHGVQVQITFEDLDKLVMVSSPNVTVVKTNGAPLAASDLKAHLDVTYVFLDTEERDRFATGCFEQLITQVQALQQTATSRQVILNLNFNHPVIELLFAVRRKCKEVSNNWFDYSGKYNEDPIKSVSLALNNLQRFAKREGRYFRLVQPYQHHTNIPDAFVYSYSFALHPEDTQPSGSCNFSRIDNIQLTLELQDDIFVPGANETSSPEISAIIFARNWNVIRYRDGLGGLAFAN